MLDRGAPSHVRMLIGAGLDTWAGSQFVQDRLALLGKTVFLLSFGFFAVINGILIAGGLPILPLLMTQANVWHFLSSSVMAVLWAITRARPLSLRTLGILDGVSVLLPGMGLAMMAAQPDEKHRKRTLFG
jgi:hypothetical protein